MVTGRRIDVKGHESALMKLPFSGYSIRDSPSGLRSLPSGDLCMLRDIFAEKRALITGASGGIGSCIVRRLTASGALVGLVARRRSPLEELQKEIIRAGGTAIVAPADVTDRAALLGAIDTVRDAWGGIDIAIACAGTYVRGEVMDSDPSIHEDQWRTSYLGTLYLFQEVIPAMLERGWGRLGLVSSVIGFKGMPRESAYAAGKAAEAGMAGILRQELHGTDVFLSTVHPSRTDTPMIAALEVPLISRKISPDRVARALLKGMRKKKPYVIVPSIGPRMLWAGEMLSPRLADTIVRWFRLSGWITGEED